MQNSAETLRQKRRTFLAYSWRVEEQVSLRRGSKGNDSFGLVLRSLIYFTQSFYLTGNKLHNNM